MKKIFAGFIEEEIKAPAPEWEIDAEIDSAKKLEAMEFLKNGMKTRKVANFLGILPNQIKRVEGI